MLKSSEFTSQHILFCLCAVAGCVMTGPEMIADDEQPTAFRGARILTAAGDTYASGVLIIDGGKIVAVGDADKIKIPDDATVHDLKGHTIIPGLVDTHSHLGVYSRPGVPANSDGNESTGPVQAIVRAMDAINPYDPGIRMARAGGITTANIMPGSGNVIGGQTLYVKLRGYTPEQMMIHSDRTVGGLKMANGENPKRNYGSRNQAPQTRMKLAALQRSEFLKAQAYMKKWDTFREDTAAGKDVEAPAADPALEPIVQVLRGQRTVHFHTHRADDIVTVLRLQREFGFDLVIQHGTEAYKVLDQIAEAGVAVSMTVVDSPGGKAEVVDLIEECGAELERRGIPVIVNTDDPITESRLFLRTAAIPVRGGLSPEEGLRSITLNAAKALKLEDRVGSLEVGKDADFVVLSGQPFSIYTRVVQTWIDGEKMFDLSDKEDARYQTGGFALPRELRPDVVDLIKPPKPGRKLTAKDRGEVTPDTETFAVVARQLHTVATGPISNGVVIIRDGKIASVGPIGDVKIPAGMPIVTAVAVTPGLIDAYSVVPLNGEYNIPADQDANETTDSIQADVRVLDGFNPAEPLLRHLLQNGVTVIHAGPGRNNVIGGMTGVFRTQGRTADEMAVKYPHAMLFSLGEASKGGDGQPGTRMGSASLIRARLSKVANAQRKADDGSAVDLGDEAIARVLSGEVAALFCAQRADDIQTSLRLIEEFELRGQLALATEGYLAARQIRKAGVPVIIHPTMQRNGAIETFNSYFGNAATLHDAKVPVAFASAVEDYVPKTRVVRHEAGLAMVYGLGQRQALRSLTLESAEILGIADKYGSLETGKVADLVLYDGDPFEHTTHVIRVFMDGREVHNRAHASPLSVTERMQLLTPSIPCCLGF